MVAAGNCQWFLDAMAALGHQVWIGDAVKIRASDARQQKHDRRDAALLLRLLMEGRFPRIWTPSSEQKDLRQLLIHRHKLERLRAQAKNGLQHLALNRGLQKQRRLWSKTGQALLRDLALPPWASRRQEPVALSSRSQDRGSRRKIMADVQVVSMVGGTIRSPSNDYCETSSVLVLHLLWQSRGVQTIARMNCALTTPSFSSRGTRKRREPLRTRRWSPALIQARPVRRA